MNNRISNILEVFEQLFKDIVALFDSMKDFFSRYFETEDPTQAEETTVA